MRHCFWLIISLGILLPGSGLAEPAKLSDVPVSWVGEAMYDNAGISIASVGDVNGDGFNDILIGAHNNDEGGANAGKVYLVFGKDKGGQAYLNLAEADVAFIGEAEFDGAGSVVAYAGDVNGDGLGDFLIGAANNDERGDNTGKAYLIFGKKEGWSKKIPLSQADVSFLGERSEDYAGSGLGYVGDVNGDGFDDFMIGSKNNTDGGEEAGKCYLIWGKAGTWDKRMKLANADVSFIGEDKNDRVGGVMAYAGDVNGDGYDDFLIGAPLKNAKGPESGQVYLFLGRAIGLIPNMDLSRADATFIGEDRDNTAGNALGFIGDLNGDGLSDFIIAAENNSETGKSAGKCYLFWGKEKGWRKDISLPEADVMLNGEQPGDHFGSAIAYSGDFTAHGQEGFVISATRSDEGEKKAGKIYFYQSQPQWAHVTDAATSFLNYVGEKKNDLAGSRLAYAGDINGDGLPDVLIGADSASHGGRQAGQVYLVTGQINRPPAKITQVGFKRDASYSKDLDTQVEAGDWLYLEVKGEDAQKERRNVMQVFAATGSNNKIKVNLVETKEDSGVFRGRFQLVETRSNELLKRLAVKSGDTISVFLKGLDAASVKVHLKVSYADCLIDDDVSGESFGNGNAHMESGETIELGVVLENNYFQNLTGITAALSTSDPNVNLLKGELSFGNIASKQRQSSSSSALFRISANCVSGQVLNFKLNIKSKEGLKWEDDFSLPVENVIMISGKLTDSLTGLPVDDATVVVLKKKKKEFTMSGHDGVYKLYLPAGEYKETLVITAAGYLNLKKAVNCAKESRLDLKLAPRQKLTAAPVTFSGERTYDSSGDAASYAGDVNGDGYDDFLIASWGNDEGGLDAGKVYLIFGRAGGWDKQFNLDRADASFIGESEYDEAGRSVAYAGDVNGDGFSDFLIGAPKNDFGGDKSGQTYLFLGKPAGWKRNTLLSEADASFIGEANHDRAGSAISYAGDVNGDGYDDFLIGAWANDTNGYDAGAAYLILGKPDGWYRRMSLESANASWVGEFPRDEAGKAVAYAGDVNGDGYDDFLIGAPSFTTESKDFVGKTYLILGRPFDWGWKVKLDQADSSFLGEDNNDSSGQSIGFVGDVNGDGLSDFAIGAWSSDSYQADAGQVYIFFGRRELWGNDLSLASADASLVGENEGDSAGWSVSMAGDVNGDGFDDILIGAWRNKFNKKEAGQSYLILGKADGWEMRTSLAFADKAFFGKSEGDASGRAVTYVGDVNGDGYDDMLIGAKGEDTRGQDAGESYLLLTEQNSPPGSVATLTITANSVVGAVAAEDNNDPSLINPYQELEIELIGLDSDPKNKNVAEVLFTGTSRPNLFKLRLYETDLNTGVYRGKVKVTSTSSNFFERRFLAHGASKVTIMAKEDSSVYQIAGIADILPPYITNMSPAPNVQRAPVASSIAFDIIDLGSGVDKDRVSLWINEEQVTPQISAFAEGCHVNYVPAGVFEFDKPVEIQVQAQDIANPPHLMNTGYSFQTAGAGGLLNPGFEEGELAFWHKKDEAGAITTLESNIAHSGNNSCRIDFTGRHDLRYINLFQGPIPIQPDSAYLLKAFVMTENISSMEGVRLYVEGASQSGRVSQADPGYFQSESGSLWDTNEWTQLTVAFTTTPETKYLHVYVARWSGGDIISGKAWIDDFYLMDKSEPGFGWQSFISTFKEFFR
ncbi:MAG: FG-GAP repeat protein [Candidatus Schekmanbacteria bacterium]|nr:FG-GAP repeat protein [Candidatus Schekmanbacteria bacterium]